MNDLIERLDDVWCELFNLGCDPNGYPKDVKDAITALREQEKKHNGLLQWAEGAKLDNEALQARIEELEKDLSGCVRLIAAQETELNK